eukprot:scaffold9195_cov69-Cyclotella_meneghiniana.AAC.7
MAAWVNTIPLLVRPNLSPARCNFKNVTVKGAGFNTMHLTSHHPFSSGRYLNLQLNLSAMSYVHTDTDLTTDLDSCPNWCPLNP